MSILKRVLLWLMGAFYVWAGVAHFLRPDFYLPMKGAEPVGSTPLPV